MLQFISIPAIVMAAVSIYVAVNYLLIYATRLPSRGYLTFGLTCLAAGFYSFFSAGLYNAANTQDGAHWLRAQFITLGLFGSLFLLFGQFYTRQLSTRWTTILAAANAALIPFQLFDRSALTWRPDLPAIKHFLFLGKYPVTYHEITPGPLTNVQVMLLMLTAGYLLYGAMRFYRKGFQREAAPLVLGLLVMFAAVANDAMITFGAYRSVYLVEYAYFGVLLVMSQTSLVNLVGADEYKLELQIRAREMANIHGLLEQRVQERTAEIVEQKQFSDALIHNLPVAVAILDLDSRILSTNPAFEGLFGYSSAEASGQPLESLIVPTASAGQVRRTIEKTRRGETVNTSGTRIRKDGTTIEVEVRAAPVAIGDHQAGTMVIYNDLTERNLAVQALVDSETRYRSLFEEAPISLWEEDFSAVKVYLDSMPVGEAENLEAYLQAHPEAVVQCASLVKILSVNQATLEIFKAQDINAFFKGLDFILTEESYPVFAQELVAFAGGETLFTGEIVQRKLNGEKIHAALRLAIAPGHEKNWTKVFVSLTDITERRRFVEHLEYLSTHDPLTGLPNRSLLLDRLGHAISLAHRSSGRVALLYLDLDKFKPINDTYGHNLGDIVLETIARRMQSAVRESDTVARIGGDEFAVIIENLQDPQDALAPAEKIREAISLPICEGEQPLQVTASIGISIYPLCAASAENLIIQADEAMYAAKKTGNQIYLCEKALQAPRLEPFA